MLRTKLCLVRWLALCFEFASQNLTRDQRGSEKLGIAIVSHLTAGFPRLGRFSFKAGRAK